MIEMDKAPKGGVVLVDEQSYNSAGSAPEVTGSQCREEVRGHLNRLRDSDLEVVRVLDDLIDLLVGKGVIRYTDLPQAARDKLQARQADRRSLGELSSLLTDEDQLML